MDKNSSEYLTDHLAGRWHGQPFPYAPPYTIYHEMMTAEYSPIIELDSSNGLSPVYRDRITTTGDGTVTNNTAEHVVASGATANSTAELRTHERGRYQPGIMALAGHGVRRPVAPTGDQEIWWEFGDEEDGARVGEDSTGLYVQHRHELGDGPKIYQGDWNGDNLNGEGGNANLSGSQIDLTKTNVWRTRFSHYGAGPVQIMASFTDQDGRNLYLMAHEFTAEPGRTIFAIPRLPLREFVSNGTTGGNIELFVGGREFAVLGRYEPNRRQTSEFSGDTTVDTTLTPLITFRKKDLRQFTSRSVKVSGLSFLTGEDTAAEIILGGTLTGASFGAIDNVVPEETALEVDTSATAISGGTRLDGAMGTGGQGNRRTLTGVRNLGVDIPDDTPVTLAARTFSASTDVRAIFTLEEEA